MNCNLSSTGLQNIEANEITADNISINTDLNVSGFSLLNSLIVNNTTTLLSSLNVSGFTSLNNNTTLLSSLNVSGFTSLNNNTTLLSSLNVSGFTTLNNRTTLLSSLNVSGLTLFNNDVTINASLYLSGLNVLETLETHGTAISTLHRFRSDNPQAIVSYNTNNGSTEIHGYNGEIIFDTTQTMSLSKIDINGKLNVYHDFDELLPTHLAGYWVVHDKLAYLLKQDLSYIANEIIQQVEIARVAGIATGTAATLAALVLLFGVGSILQNILGGGDGGGEGTPVIDMFAINLSINENKNNLNSLSTNSMLSITSILGCINTGFSSLHVSGFTTLNNNVTLLSSLNVSGFAILNNNTSILGTLNVSGLTTLNNNVSLCSLLNVSGFTTLNNITIASRLNVSGFTILNNNTSIFGTLNVSGFTTLNNTTFVSSLNVSGFTTLNNNTSIFGSLNVSGFTTLNTATILSSLNVSGLTTLSNNTTILSSLNVSGLTTLLNHTNIRGILSVDNGNQYAIPNGRMQKGSLTIGDTLLNYGNLYYETLPSYDGPNWTTNTSGLLMECVDNTEIAVHRNSNNKVSSLLCYVGGTTNTIILGRDMGWGGSSLDIKGKTTIGFNPIPLSDAVFEVYNNISIRKNRLNFNNVNVGDYAYISAGTGFSKCSLSLEDGYDANITSLKGVIGLNASNTQVSGDLYVNGRLINGTINQIVSYISAKIPVNFTTSRTVTVNGVNYSAYDLNLNTYTKFLLLDGRKIRQFRLRSWHASGDFENYSAEIALSYHMFMSDFNGLSIKAFSAPYLNLELDQVNGSTPSFYRNNFDTITYLAPLSIYGSNVKVYCIFEDLL